jgi:diguanylate cyclase (GGDEF)-like protein
MRERMRRLSEQLLAMKQNSLQDPETLLPNRILLEQHIESMIEHCNARGGGLGIALIEVSTGNDELRPSTLQTIANSIQLALRPMDIVSRYDRNTFAVLVQYQDPKLFNLDLFSRLIDNIRRQTLQTSDQGQDLQISIGTWHGHELDPAPSMADIIAHAKQACAPIA